MGHPSCITWSEMKESKCFFFSNWILNPFGVHVCCISYPPFFCDWECNAALSLQWWSLTNVKTQRLHRNVFPNDHCIFIMYSLMQEFLFQGPARVGFWSSRSENKKLSLFFEKCKVKKKCFHSFSRSAKWNQNAFTLFREVKSEIKMLRDRDREVKILENS